MAIQPDNASDELIARLFGDDLALAKATSAAMDRIETLMRPALNAETLANGRHNEIDLRNRDIRYECHGVFRGKQLWSCWDERSYDGAPDSRSNCIGHGDSKEMALVDLMDKLEPSEEPPAPRLRLVDGGGGVSPPEFEERPYVDPDQD